MTTSTSPQTVSAEFTPAELSVARRIYTAADALEVLVEKLAETHEQPGKWQHMREFLVEVKEGAFRGETTPEELTGWAVSLTFAAVETRIRSVEPSVFFLIRSFGEACLLGARYQEERVSGIDTEDSISEFNAAVDFVIDGAPFVVTSIPAVWKTAA